MHSIIQNLEVKIYFYNILKDTKLKITLTCFGSYVMHHQGVQSCAWLKLLVVIHRYFVVCLVGVWQRNFERVVCVCVCVRSGRPEIKEHLPNMFRKSLLFLSYRTQANILCPYRKGSTWITKMCRKRYIVLYLRGVKFGVVKPILRYEHVLRCFCTYVILWAPWVIDIFISIW